MRRKLIKEEVIKLDEIVRDDLQPGFKKGRPLIPKHLIDLYFRPKKFFLSQIALGKTPYILFATWIVGISTAIGRIDKNLAKIQFGTKPELSKIMGVIVDSWLHFWPIVIVLGSISAVFLWAIGGWWYNVRIKWSGAIEHDRLTGRIVYIYTSFIYAFPSILLVIFYNLLYPNYRSAYNADEWYSLIVLIFPFWSVVNSYKGVSNVFNINNLKTKLWFLVFPFILYLVAIGGIAALFMFLQKNS